MPSCPSMDRILSKPKFLKCLVTHVSASKTQVEIWGQTDVQNAVRLESALDSNHILLSDLFAIISQNLRPINVPEVGQNYLTHMKGDLHFHRGVVTHVNSELKEALVLFIDFGNEEWVPFNHLVQMDALFQVKPLAQKYFLADIKPRKEWNAQEVKRCLQQYLLLIFNCEVIGISQNTECIRIYSQSFEQPLINSLVKHCNGLLQYPNCPEVFEAIDLTVSVKNNANDSKDELQQPEQCLTEPEPIFEVDPKNEILKDNDIGSSALMANNFGSKAEDEVKSSIKEELVVSDNAMPIPIERSLNNEYKHSDGILNGMSNGLPNQTLNRTLNGTLEHSDKLKETYGGDTHSPKEDTKKEVILTNGFHSNYAETEEQTVKTEGVPDINAMNGHFNVENSDQIDCGSHSVKPIIEDLTTKVELNHKDEVKELNSNTEEVQKNVTPQNEEMKLIPEATSPSMVLASEASPLVVDTGVDLKLVGQTLSIYLSSSKNDFTFFCQKTSKFDEIATLADKMTEFYDKIYKKDDHRLESAIVGQWVAARFSTDNLWYRASVTAIDGNQLQVFYLDYGNTESVDISECKLLVDDFNEKVMSPQAIHCTTVGEKIPIDKVEAYILDFNELVVNFVGFKDGVYELKVIEIKL